MPPISLICLLTHNDDDYELHIDFSQNKRKLTNITWSETLDVISPLPCPRFSWGPRTWITIL